MKLVLTHGRFVFSVRRLTCCQKPRAMTKAVTPSAGLALTINCQRFHGRGWLSISEPMGEPIILEMLPAKRSGAKSMA